jgi:hypothetical protein
VTLTPFDAPSRPRAIPQPATTACHHCAAPAELSWQRHATQAEYDALPDNQRPIDGRAVVPVYGCGDHALAAFCDHTPAPEQPCPTCHAAPGAACTTANGSPRAIDHPARRNAALAAQPTVCTHAHRENCPGYGGCTCTQDDPAPTRTPRTPPPDDRAARAARQQQIYAAEQAWHEELLAKHGGDHKAAAAEACATYWDFLAQHTAGNPGAD